MTRVKRGVIANKRRKKLIKQAKGFKWGRKSKYRQVKDALRKAWTYAYRDRKVKKRNFRELWQVQINAACRNATKDDKKILTYSKFIHLLKLKNIEIDRKILSKLAKENPAIFKEIVTKVKQQHTTYN